MRAGIAHCRIGAGVRRGAWIENGDPASSGVWCVRRGVRSGSKWGWIRIGTVRTFATMVVNDAGDERVDHIRIHQRRKAMPEKKEQQKKAAPKASEKDRDAKQNMPGKAGKKPEPAKQAKGH